MNYEHHGSYSFEKSWRLVEFRITLTMLQKNYGIRATSLKVLIIEKTKGTHFEVTRLE